MNLIFNFVSRGLSYIYMLYNFITGHLEVISYLLVTRLWMGGSSVVLPFFVPDEGHEK
jgi:hypothetical protein